jgi:hypothetical protein
MIISHRWRFVYVGPPKTASTTLHHWLSQPTLCDQRWTPDRQDQHSVVIPAEVRDYFTFASIRDPLDRAVSLWAHSQSPASLAGGGVWPMSFEEFVLEFQPQASWFYRLSQAELLAPVRLDGVVRVERLEEDLRRLPPIAAAGRAGEVLEPLPRFNETSHPPWERSCTPQRVARLAHLWSENFGLCGIGPQAEIASGAVRRNRRCEAS